MPSRRSDPARVRVFQAAASTMVSVEINSVLDIQGVEELVAQLNRTIVEARRVRTSALPERPLYKIPYKVNLPFGSLEEVLGVCTSRNRYRKPVAGDRVLFLEGMTWVVGTVGSNTTVPYMETEEYIYPIHQGTSLACFVSTHIQKGRIAL